PRWQIGRREGESAVRTGCGRLKTVGLPDCGRAGRAARNGECTGLTNGRWCCRFSSRTCTASAAATRTQHRDCETKRERANSRTWVQHAISLQPFAQYNNGALAGPVADRNASIEPNNHKAIKIIPLAPLEGMVGMRRCWPLRPAPSADNDIGAPLVLLFPPKPLIHLSQVVGVARR